MVFLGLLDYTSMYGFQAQAGYRWNAWLDTDLEVIYAGGGEIRTDSSFGSIKIDDTWSLAGSLNARIHPISLFGEPRRRTVEWTIALGLGGGRLFEGDRISLADSTFLVRFGTGLEWMLGDHFGLYADSGYFVSTSTTSNGFGFLSAGVGYRF